MSARLFNAGKPRHASEAEAIQFLVERLPNNYIVFSNLDISTGRAGETYEHDVIVVAPHAVFAVEIKGWGGRTFGNRDRWTLSDGFNVQSPLPLILSKARSLKGLLVARRMDLRAVWVQALVFLSPPDADPRITPDYEALVTTRSDLHRALTDKSVWGLNNLISPPQISSILTVLADGKPTAQPSRLGVYELTQRLEADDRPYSLWLGKHRFDGHTHLLHVYTLQQSTETLRARMRALAEREKDAYNKLYGIQDLHRYFSCDMPADADPPCVVLSFEDTTPLLPLLTWVASRKPRMSARLHVAIRVARALALVHERSLVHRRMTPEAILVSNEDEPTAVRLTGFELARDLSTSSLTISGGSYSGPGFRCIAPEVLRTHETRPASDLFSLGATFFELITGTRLFQSSNEVYREITARQLSALEGLVSNSVITLLQDLLKLNPADRPADAEQVADRLERIVSAPARAASQALQPGRVLHDTYELQRVLGRGATSVVWLAHHLQRNESVALKLASAEHAEVLRNEDRVLRRYKHDHLVACNGIFSYEDGSYLVMDFVDALDASQWRMVGDALTPADFRTVASGLLDALAALHQGGWLHRDIKPENLLIRVQDLHPFLNDLGLAAAQDVPGELAVGTARYKDPLLWKERAWTPANDLFAAVLVLYELLTGMYPFAHGTPEPDEQPRIVGDEFPATFPASLVAALSELFAASLAPERGVRPASARETLARLDELFAEPATAPQTAAHAPRPETASLEPLGTASATPPPSPPTPALVEPPAPLPPVVTSAPSASVSGLSHAQPLTPAIPIGPRLPETLSLEQSLLDLPASVRARGVFARIGLTSVDDLRSVSPDTFSGLPNAGTKTRNEILALQAAVRSRWPLPTPEQVEAPPAPQCFFPYLISDSRTVAELGLTLTPALRAGLDTLGISTLGELCAMPEAVLRELPGVGSGRIARVREALQQLAGLTLPPSTLAELDGRLKRELGESPHLILTGCLGLKDGLARAPSDVAASLHVTRQYAHMAVPFDKLQHGSSMGAWLAERVLSLLPSVGFSSLEALAEALAQQLPPPEEGGLHPLGFARLGALLLEPEPGSAQARQLDLCCVPPWSPELLQTLQRRLADAANWPPIPRSVLAHTLWDSLEESIRLFLIQRGLDERLLLEALLRLCPDVQETQDGYLFVPPVTFELGAAWLRPHLSARLPLRALEERLQSTFQAVNPPVELSSALQNAGFRLEGQEVVDLERAAAPLESPLVDALIPRQSLTIDQQLPPVLAALAQAVSFGGFRVLVLPPAQHHLLAPQLANVLAQALGPDRVHFIDVDRVLLTALQKADLWDDVLFYDARSASSASSANTPWRWTHATLIPALEQALSLATPGTLTVLGRPSLLGTLDLMTWLSSFYDRARGGRFGLCVLAMPGGIHDNRLRLNERYNLAYTPDMAAVYLDISEMLPPGAHSKSAVPSPLNLHPALEARRSS